VFDKLPERIEINPDIMLGKPVIKGTRIPVYLLIEKLEAGESVENLLDSHPRLTREDAQVVIDFSKKDSKDTK